MDLFGERKEKNNFDGLISGHQRYRLWKFQINTFMKAHGLVDNVKGNVPNEEASNDVKMKYK